MDYNLCDYNTVSRLLNKHGFKFSKALGQNFIIDETVCPQMAQELKPDRKTAVLEIGPGIGVLTKELCKRAGRVAAVELDRRLYPLLNETLGDYGNFELIEGDVMKLDLKKLLQEKLGGFDSVKICANLPYYITSPVIMTLLESRLPVDEIVVMVQREAADRLCAEAGTRESGAVSAAVQYYGKAEILFDVRRECFMPSPKVDSAVIKITPYTVPKYSVDDEKAFFALIKAAFAQRRKTVVNSVSATLGIPKEKVAEALASLSLDVNIRAEKLTMENFVELSKIL
ncbi:MAG: 16S rRNA (adenine(1518)-N(6)/adenine(1519)-N(6))-dimethyltransferase RsmA [Eubacterium sp.]|nr:16S rRNA (adenine(1518)-N(6)/adenine(1519)-N(6))-dimethyltransferase RsmA [Eubacterium sp.]